MKSATLGAVLLPSYAEMIESAAAAATAAFVVMVCKSAKLETPLPLSAVAAIAANTAARLSVVTPVKPIAASSADVNAGVGFSPAAVWNRREMIDAKVAISP